MKTNPKIKFITLGCKVNQYETQGMREMMERAGAGTFEGRQASPEVDFVVINTCTVTEEADKEGRYWIRRSKRDYPNARIVVTGCGVTQGRAAFEALVARLTGRPLARSAATVTSRHPKACSLPSWRDLPRWLIPDQRD